MDWQRKRSAFVGSVPPQLAEDVAIARIIECTGRVPIRMLIRQGKGTTADWYGIVHFHTVAETDGFIACDEIDWGIDGVENSPIRQYVNWWPRPVRSQPVPVSWPRLPSQEN